MLGSIYGSVVYASNASMIQQLLLASFSPYFVPDKVWTDIFMDFIEGLPKSFGKDVIMVVVGRLSKYAHFIPISHPLLLLE